MTAGLKIGVDATYLTRDTRGMGRCVRTILQQWEENPERFILLALSRRHLASLKEYSQRGWHTCLYNEAPDLSVCWFPWNRIDWDPECPRVALIHDVAPFTEFHPHNRHREDDQARLAEAVRHADAVMTISSFSRAEIHHHLGYPIEEMEVIYWAPDRYVFSPSPLVRKDLLPEALHDKPFLLYVGTLEPRKNLRGLLEAMALLQKQIPHQLALVCPQPTTSWTDKILGRTHELEEITRALAPRLVWLDQLDDARLVELYRRTDLFVMPSLYEGFGLPLLEALACGTKVAAARAASLPEVGGNLPRWFNPKDSVDIAKVIMEALEWPGPDPEELEQHLQHFHWTQTAEEVLHFLEEVGQRPRRSNSGVFPSLPAHLQIPEEI
ncbi:glycosyltransferase family 4 protein [bacterium]|nr:glycosyltransferase family 4 protein [bacterium]